MYGYSNWYGGFQVWNTCAQIRIWIKNGSKNCTHPVFKFGFWLFGSPFHPYGAAPMWSTAAQIGLVLHHVLTFFIFILCVCGWAEENPPITIWLRGSMQIHRPCNMGVVLDPPSTIWLRGSVQIHRPCNMRAFKQGILNRSNYDLHIRPLHRLGPFRKS